MVERLGVADHVDALDVDARALGHLEGDVDLAGLGVGARLRLDVDEGEARGAGGEGQGVHRRFHALVGVGLAGAQRQQRAQDLRVQPVELGGHLQLAELVLRALVDGEGDGEAGLVDGQLGHRGGDAEIVEAAVAVVLAQLLAVVLDAVGS